MAEGRRLIKLKHSLVVAVPPVVREQLQLAQGQTVWWHLAWQGEALLSTAPQRADAYPGSHTLHEELVTLRARVLRLQQRNQARDDARYAEGYTLGRLDGQA